MSGEASLGAWRGRFAAALALILALSAYGNAVMSQFDAPYGTLPAAESALHALAGGLLVYTVIVPLLLRPRRALPVAAAFLAAAIICTSAGYRLFTELYRPLGYLEYLATSLTFFILGIPVGAVFLPYIFQFIQQFIV